MHGLFMAPRLRLVFDPVVFASTVGFAGIRILLVFITAFLNSII